MTKSQILTTTFFAILVFSRVLVPQANAVESGPRNTYSYSIQPAHVIAKLEGLAVVKASISADDKALFDDAQDGKLDEHTFGEAMLIASGVKDKQKRQEYLAQLAKLELEARKAFGDNDKPIEQGDLLLKFLHDGAMAEGYDSGQTDLHTILDSGKFNCVSSACLYNVLANRLGLEVRAVEIPEHVFSIINLGKTWADVETTNALGFNPSRDPETAKNITKPGGTVYMPEKHKDLRRQVDQLGLIAIVYYNHGVTFSNQKRQDEAIVASFSALCFDRNNANAIKNAMAGLTNWPMDLCDAGKFEEALQVLSVGLELSPTETGLVNNRQVAWQKYAKSQVESGDDKGAVAVLRRAAADMPSSDFIIRQAEIFIRQAQPHIAKGDLNRALAVCGRGMTMVDTAAKERLQNWQSAQVHNHVLRTMKEKINAGQFESALSVIANHSAQLDDSNQVRNFQLQVYDSWAGKEMDLKNWQAAAGIYISALEQMPQDTHLTKNTVYVYDSWAHEHMQQEEWAAAIEVYQQALNRFPNNGHLTNNLAYCQSKLDD